MQKISKRSRENNSNTQRGSINNVLSAQEKIAFSFPTDKV